MKRAWQAARALIPSRGTAGLWVLSALALMSSAPTIAAADAAPGLCTAQESTYFSCPASRGRTIALCGVSGALPQYRFGRPGAVEMRFPDKGTEGPMFFAHYSRYQTDRVEIRFDNQGVEYVVFDHVESGRRRAGVRVTTVDAKERELACTRAPESRLIELEGVLACDRDSALNGGACR